MEMTAISIHAFIADGTGFQTKTTKTGLYSERNTSCPINSSECPTSSKATTCRRTEIPEAVEGPLRRSCSKKWCLDRHNMLCRACQLRQVRYQLWELMWMLLHSIGRLDKCMEGLRFTSTEMQEWGNNKRYHPWIATDHLMKISVSPRDHFARLA